MKWVRASLALAISTVLLPFATFLAIVYQLAVEKLSPFHSLMLIAVMATVFLLVWKLGKSPRLIAMALLGWSVGTMTLATYFFGGPVPKLATIGIWWLSTVWIFFASWLPMISATMPDLIRRPYWLLPVPLFMLLFHVGEIRGDGLIRMEWRWRYQPLPAVATTVAEPPDQARLPRDGSFPGFLGPKRNAMLDHTDINEDWRSHPPLLIWRQSIGQAWSGVAVARGIIVTQEQDDKSEAVAAFDADTGHRRWRVADDSFFDGNAAGPGPRATPMIDADRVYSIGAAGILNCLDLSTGKVQWTRNILTDHGAQRLEHGLAGSPLVVGELVIVALPAANGPTLAAYRKSNGEPVWTAGKRPASYSSPTLVRIQDRDQVVILDSAGLIAVDPIKGTELGQVSWGDGGNRCPQPVFVAEPTPSVILSSYECGGTTRFELKSPTSGAWTGQEVWNSPILKTKFTTPVLVDNLLFGIDRGILVCLDAETGKRIWKSGRYGEGQLLLVGQQLLILGEEGDLVLIKPSADGLQEQGRIQAIEGKTWNSFAVVDHFAFVRNSREIACYDLGQPDSPEKDEPTP